MFGMAPKRRGLFGGGLPGPIGGYGGGTWNVDGTQATPVERHGYAQDGEAPRKGGFFAQGGAGRAIAGTIGDVLLQRGGLAPIYAPTMRAQQQARLAEQDAQRERAEWMFREQWKRDNPEARVNDTVQDFNWYKGLSDADRKIYHKMRPQYRQGADGRFYPVEVAEDAPDTLPADFDFGGPSQPATGGFPRR